MADLSDEQTHKQPTIQQLRNKNI